ncbi:MAG: glycine cleavage T C-terminal barrel domain-containing protein [Dongiaceae bacterium]
MNNTLSRLFPAGFYYKTFMWPPSAWMRYEAVIRRAAGLGKAPREPDPDRYDKTHAHCDVLVVGAGPAGLAAALAAARTGARVILADEQAEMGGSLLAAPTAASRASRRRPGSPPPWPSLRRCPRSAAAAHHRVRLFRPQLPRARRAGLRPPAADRLGPPCASASGGSAPGGRAGDWRYRAPAGLRRQRPPRRHAGRGGRHLRDALRRAARRRPLFLANNDSAYRAALAFAEAGAEHVAVVDLRPAADGPLPAQARARGVEVLANHAVVGTIGRGRVEGAKVMADRRRRRGRGRRPQHRLRPDRHGRGWNPTVHLFSQSRGKLVLGPALAAFVPGVSAQAERSAGGARGSFGLAQCLAEGFAAGREAAARAGFDGPAGEAPETSPEPEEAPLRPLWVVPADRPVGRGHKHFVDHQNDVTAADVLLAAREGYRSVEHLKRYTTMGMGTDQGKTSNVNALAIMAATLGTEIPAVGTTTFRPPYTPVTIGTFAGHEKGDLLDPIRRTPMHGWHEARGALFENVGQWRRAWYYPKPGETMHEAVNREVKATRTGVGIVDASTLGKIDLQGPDVPVLLNWVYTNAFTKLEVGRCRYGLMLGEDGMVLDDGVTTRLGEQHWLMSTTTGNAARVLGWLENWLQCEWPHLKVFCTSVTEQWATVAINGPMARRLLGELTADIDLDPQLFPFMAVREGHVAGIPARVFRISFTGELSFEINVPASYGLALWQALMAAGEKYGITPYGTEAMHVLRAEKGYIIVGQETDGTITPGDLGMDWIVSKQKPDFLGKRSLLRADTARADRKHLVGLLTENPSEVLPEGGQIVAELRPQPPMTMLGYVTSSYYSPNLGRSIALALVKNGRARMGDTVHVPLAGRTISAKVTEPRFIDPEGARLNG